MLNLKPYRKDQMKFSQVCLLYPTIDLEALLFAGKEI
jgi:hypothetical protein